MSGWPEIVIGFLGELFNFLFKQGVSCQKN